MQITTKTDPPKFQPCSLTITFDSQDELDALGTLFNHARLTDAVEKVFKTRALEEVYVAAKKLGAEINSRNEQIGRALRDEFKHVY